MRQSAWLSLLAAGVVAAVMPGAAYILFQSDQKSASAPALRDLVNLPVLPHETKLFSRQAESSKGATNVMPEQETSAFAGEKFAVTDIVRTFPGGSFEVTVPQPGTLAGDRVRKQSVRSYFARQPGEAFWRLNWRQSFDLDETLVSEDAFRLDKTPERHGLRHADGNYELLTWFEDGQTLASRQLTPPAGQGSSPLLLERWRPQSEGHALLFSNYRDGAGNRTITEYTLRRNRAYPEKITESSDSGIYGTRVRAWYTGTDILRLECNANYSGTKASFYRPNSTLYRTLELGRITHNDTFFTADGKTALYTQSWEVRPGGKNGSKEREVLTQIVEMTPEQKISRVLIFDNESGRLTKISRYNFSEGGVKYKLGEYRYRQDGGDWPVGTLEHADLQPEDSRLPVKSVDYAPSAKVTGPDIPREELAAPDMSDNLPLGPANKMGPR